MGATVLFLPSPSASGSWGSTVRLATIAEECRKRGDRVVFHACEPTDELLRQRGLEVVPFTGIAPAGRGHLFSDGFSGSANLADPVSGFDIAKGLGVRDLPDIRLLRLLKPAHRAPHFRSRKYIPAPKGLATKA